MSWSLVFQCGDQCQKQRLLLQLFFGASRIFYAKIKENLKENTLKKIALPIADGLRFVELTDIIYLEAEGAYTHVLLKDSSKLLISKKLKEFETLLSDTKNFFRIHRSFLMNTAAIQQYIKSDGGSILMSNNVSVPVARERKDDFQKLIESIRL